MKAGPLTGQGDRHAHICHGSSESSLARSSTVCKDEAAQSAASVQSQTGRKRPKTSTHSRPRCSPWCRRRKECVIPLRRVISDRRPPSASQPNPQKPSRLPSRRTSALSVRYSAEGHVVARMTCRRHTTHTASLPHCTRHTWRGPLINLLRSWRYSHLHESAGSGVRTSYCFSISK